MHLSTNPSPAPADARPPGLFRDAFYRCSNAERNIRAALENYVLRHLPRRQSCVAIGCGEPLLAVHLADAFPAMVAVDEDAALLAEITARNPRVVACQIEPDDFKLIGRTDMILVTHLLQSLGSWLDAPEERNHQRMAFLTHYFGSLEPGGALVLLQNRPQNNYRQLLEYLSLSPSEETGRLFQHVGHAFASEHYLFPIEVNTRQPDDMVQALRYLLGDRAEGAEQAASLHTFVQTLQQLDGNYYFNYEGEMLVVRKPA